MRFLTPAEQQLLEHARPPERTIIRDLYELLDARLVSAPSFGAAFEPRWGTVGDASGPLDGPAPSVLEVGAAPEPLFPTEEAA